MYYDLNITWPLSAMDASKKRNTSKEHTDEAKALASYVNALAVIAGAPDIDPEKAQQQRRPGKEQKGKNRTNGQSNDGAGLGSGNADPRHSKPASRPSLKPFDPMTGLVTYDRERMLAVTTDAAELGYHFVAYNHIVHGRFDSQAHQNPFYDSRTKETHPPFPLLDPRTRAAEQKRRRKNAAAAPQNAANAAEKGTDKATVADDAKKEWDGVDVTQYSRCTIVLDETSFGKQGHGLTSASTNALLTYDLLAVCPLTEAAFSAACLSLSELKQNSVDIISFDLAASPRLPFMLKRSAIGAALQNGAVFEVCYGAAVSTEDVYASWRRTRNGGGGSWEQDAESRSRARRNLIAGTRELLRVTNGKGVVFSSGVADILGLRGPVDIVNLATALFGMNQAAAQDALSKTCRSLLKRAETRKTWRGIVGLPKLRLVQPPPCTTGGGNRGQAPDPLKDMGVDESGVNSSAVQASVSSKKKRGREEEEEEEKANPTEWRASKKVLNVPKDAVNGS
ncbi:PHP domain-like protein [Tilletiaria anomala UBC 951]|uniref:PHP domain-like protein n=1 Tax=Tilletiaria anomala (strain ATCC 24038 / CBS 436.72 / UBC 951) TaxID=1037660 RepID=A0A066WEA1_TILAU|nr:PHP domain-like protein [Tilletiaria anomala UBC 951]KDN52282.1 PHP domain-like protein [Tilletiaria anomala UBC 951]